MNDKSFSSRLSWRIIGIVSIIFLASFILIWLASQYVINNEGANKAPLMLALSLLLVGIVGIVVVFFVCRREIRRMTRPITELSVSALNMAMGNFKANLPEISSKDENQNVTKGDVIALNVKNSYIRAESERPVGVIGLENLVVVDSPDGLLISDINKIQDVKKIAESLKLRYNK